MVKSLLSNLIRYSPTPSRTQTENLLSEWLAETLRNCPEFYTSLISRRLADRSLHSETIIRTQFPITNQIDERTICGWMDIVIESSVSFIILEVKWDAEESGDQLSRYRKYLSSSDVQHVNRKLFLLVKSIPDAEYLSSLPDEIITWSEVLSVSKSVLRASNSTVSRGCILLRDLCQFLEEAMPETDLTLPMVSSAAQIPRLLGFCHAVLEETCQQISQRWPTYSKMWNKQMDGWFYKWLRKSGVFGTYEEFGPVQVWIGFLYQPELPYDEMLVQPPRFIERFPWAIVWVQIEPKRLDAWNKMLPTAQSFASENKNEWHTNDIAAAWRILYRVQPLNSFQSEENPQAALKDWFIKSLEQLEKGGMMRLIETFKAGEK